MYALDFSIDNLSLMALTLAVGFIVDDAIVMLENIVRHIEMGKTPLQAALDGSEEVGFTVLSMCLSLSAVFIPLLMFMGGIIGRLFREFAVTISVSVLISGFIALTLTPMLCSRLLKPHSKDEKHGRLYQRQERGFQRILGAYDRDLNWVMAHRPFTIAFSVMVLFATYFVWTRIPKGLFPPDDNGTLNANAEAPQGTPFTEMMRLGQLVSAKLAKDTNVASYTMNIGSMGPSNQIQFNITLKPAGMRPPADAMVFELRRAMSTPGVDVSVTNPPSIQIGGRGGRSSYQYTLRGPDIKDLYAQGERLLNRLPWQCSCRQRELEPAGYNGPIVRVHIDREKALRMGTTPAGIEQALANAYNQQQYRPIFMPTKRYTVVMETVPSAQVDASVLEHFYVPGVARTAGSAARSGRRSS